MEQRIKQAVYDWCLLHEQDFESVWSCFYIIHDCIGFDLSDLGLSKDLMKSLFDCVHVTVLDILGESQRKSAYI